MVKGSDLAPISRASQIDNQQRSSARSTTRDHKREHKRELILNSAIEVFAQRGFHNSRVSDVARCAGVADGTIYLYFKSKDDLLISLFEEKMEQIVERFRAEVNQRDNARDRMRCFIELHLNMVADHPTLAEVLTVELRQSAKFMREYKAPQFGAYLNLLGEIITFGQERREVNSSLDPHFARRIIFGALDELSLYWVSLKRPDETLDQAIDALWLICTGGLFVHQSGDL
jgi:TetR/AcrR family fatty acid metabolism transcriptional regulator